MRSKGTLKAGLLTMSAMALAALSTPAMAQDIQGFKPALGTWNYYSQDGVSVAPVGHFVPTLYASYGRNPLVKRDENGNIEQLIIEDMTSIDLTIGIGLHERLEAGIGVPFGYTSGGQEGDQDILPDNGAGLGDIRILPKVLLVMPDAERKGFGIALAVPMSLPTGDEDSSNSSRHFVANPKLIFEYQGQTWRAGVNGGYRWRPTNLKAAAQEPLTVGSGITFGGGAAVELGSDKLLGIAEIYGTRFNDVAEDEGGAFPVEALTGIRLFSGDLAFNLGGGVGVNPDFGAPEFRVLAGLTWAAIGGTGGPTVDMGDDDKDGVRNVADACPNDPEDRDGFQDADGCPELDNDQDGIADADDKCPVHAEDLDSFEDDDGCPDLDNDQDGIADARDQCPGKPENKNGFKDDDGCPDLTDIVMSDGSIQILQKVYFDSGKDTIKPQSYGILDQVALAIKGTPDINLLQIEGHTDQRGNDKRNLVLSKRRAAAVLTYLLGTGIQASRLTSTGYGETRPVADGSTLAGAAQNRRVEFVILQRAGQSVEATPLTPAATPAVGSAPAPVASGPGTVTDVRFSSTSDAMVFDITTNGVVDRDQVETLLDSGNKVLIIRVGGMVVGRRWLQTPHKRISRTLLHPSKERAPGAITRVRMKKKIPAAVFNGIRIAVDGSRVTVKVPTSASAARDWANEPAPASATDDEPIERMAPVAPSEPAPVEAAPVEAAPVEAAPEPAGTEPVPVAPTPSVEPLDEPSDIESPFDDEANNADVGTFGTIL